MPTEPNQILLHKVLFHGFVCGNMSKKPTLIWLQLSYPLPKKAENTLVARPGEPLYMRRVDILSRTGRNTKLFGLLDEVTGVH